MIQFLENNVLPANPAHAKRLLLHAELFSLDHDGVL